MGSLKLTTASSGSVILSPANTASDVTITVPAVTGTMITTTGGVAPSTAGNVLTSDGTNWTSAALSAPSTAQVLSAIAGASFGAIGTYAWLNYNGTTPFTEGTTVAGSSLLAAGTFSNTTITGDNSYNGATNYFTSGGSALSGTWRAMARSNTNSGSNYARMGLWLRIS